MAARRRNTESLHQGAVVEWAHLQRKRWPALECLFAVPNGTHIASGAARGKAKREGLKSGVPDLCLPVARRGYSALFIELKAPGRGAATSDAQDRWLARLNDHGCLAVVAVGANEAIERLRWYVEEGRE